MTLEQLGFVKEQPHIYRVIYKRKNYFSRYNEIIEFSIMYKNIEIRNLNPFDMKLLEAIYNKAKELI